MKMSKCDNDEMSLPNPISQIADMPYPLYLSLQGKYFVGYADDLEFNNESFAWGGLINPIDSGVNLHLFVWTVTNIGSSPLKAEIWFNAKPEGAVMESEFITPANTALCPLPVPKVKLLQASKVSNVLDGKSTLGSVKVMPEVTVVGDEDGALIFPPGGSFIITLSNYNTANQNGQCRIAFGWAEEKVCKCKHQGGV